MTRLGFFKEKTSNGDLRWRSIVMRVRLSVFAGVLVVLKNADNPNGKPADLALELA